MTLDPTVLTVPGILAILGGISALLVALLAGTASVISSWRNGAKVDALITKTDAVAVVTATVEKNTNSMNERRDTKIEQLLSQVAALTAHIAQLDITREVLAAETKVASVVSTDTQVATPVVVVNEEPVVVTDVSRIIKP